MILVQHIETLWTKRSRGMPGSAVRNSVPRALEVPIPTDAPSTLVHKVRCLESEGFAAHESIVAPDRQGGYWCLAFLSADEATQVLFSYNYHQHGKPNRPSYRRPVFTLADGEVGVLHINGRFASCSGQHYAQHFINVARLHVPSRDVFLRSEPNYYCDKTVALF